MIQFYKYLYFLGFILFSQLSFAQENDNLYSINSGKEYALYLKNSGQFEAAALEYERLLVLDSSTFYQAEIMNCYLKAEMFDVAIQRFHQFKTTDESSNVAYLVALFFVGDFSTVDSLLLHTNLATNDLWKLKMFSSLYQFDLEKAQNLLATCPLVENECDEFSELILSQQNLKLKKRGLALALSIPVPGLGRVYTGNTKDGIVSLTFIGIMAWQSYIGFKKNGIKSVYAWIFGLLGSGFYLGNMYGSYRAAQYANSKKITALLHEMDILFTRMYL